MLNNNREETGTVVAGSLATLGIYFIPALSTAPQLVQGAVTTLIMLVVVYAVGWLPQKK